MSQNKPSKPWYKRWWIWLLAVIVVIIGLSSIDSNSDSSNSSNQSASSSTHKVKKAKSSDVTGSDVRLYFLPQIRTAIHYGNAAMEAAVNGDDSANQYLADMLGNGDQGDRYTKFKNMTKKTGPHQKLAIKTHDDLSYYSNAVNDAVTSIQMHNSKAKQTAHAAKADKWKATVKKDYAQIKALPFD